MARQAAETCLASPDPPEEAVRQLCDLATAPDPELARLGANAIFRGVVEPLGDSFERRSCDRYIRFLARVLEHGCALPEAIQVRDRLCSFGLYSLTDLVQRAERLRRPPAPPAERVRRILVFSRVTLGADVAVTSVVLAKMLATFPEADLVLLGSPKAGLLFAGEGRVRLRPLEYSRSGLLLDRLHAWLGVVDAVAEETKGLAPGEYLVIDPDSRLTQLGMLPVVPDDAAYYFFESRSYQSPGHETLAQLTAAWLEEAFGPSPAPVHPWVSLPPEAAARATEFRAARKGKRCVAVNLGVGDNPRKRLEGQFEEHLLARLLAEGWRVLLDRGEGPEESTRTGDLLARLQAAGHAVAEMNETNTSSEVLAAASAEVTAWHGSLAGFAGLISASDLYVGYDSACQHLAAALGIPTIDIFAGFHAARMPQRWRPTGPAPVTMIVVVEPDRASPERLLERVLEGAR
jgi:glycosyl transferase family 9 (putative heptosyltransferase)